LITVRGSAGSAAFDAAQLLDLPSLTNSRAAKLAGRVRYSDPFDRGSLDSTTDLKQTGRIRDSPRPRRAMRLDARPAECDLEYSALLVKTEAPHRDDGKIQVTAIGVPTGPYAVGPSRKLGHSSTASAPGNSAGPRAGNGTFTKSRALRSNRRDRQPALLECRMGAVDPNEPNWFYTLLLSAPCGRT
jgi:hypothetical protein